MSSWEVNIGLGRRSVVLYLTSVAPATFSAQLCVPDEKGCTPLGEIRSVTMVCTPTRFSERLFSVWVRKCVTLLIHPPDYECLGCEDKCARSFSRSKTLCTGRRDSQRRKKRCFVFHFFVIWLSSLVYFEVWQSDPPLRGRRIVCLDRECTLNAHTSVATSLLSLSLCAWIHVTQLPQSK